MIIPYKKKQRDAVLLSCGLTLTEHVDAQHGLEVWTKDGKNYIPPGPHEDLSTEGYCPHMLQLFLVRNELAEGDAAETKSNGSMVYAVSEG